MKKILVSAISALLAICLLSGCVPTAENISQEPIIPSSNSVEESFPALPSELPPESSIVLPEEPNSEPSLSISDEPTQGMPLAPSAAPSSEPSSNPAFNIADEPPLDERSLNIAVPDFLDSEQQLLYRRAYCVYTHLFGGDTGEVNVWQEGDKYPDGMNDVEHNGMFYTKACGRYAAWDNFNVLVHSVFTDEFWNQLNGNADSGVFTNIDGSLHFIWASRGMYYYNDNVPDKFELISKEENEITFTLIGHYSSPWPEDNIEEKNQHLGSEFDYTIEFPIKLVRTQNGWRFAEFHAAIADQRGPEE